MSVREIIIVVGRHDIALPIKILNDTERYLFFMFED
ncbi:hypothetical protein AP058_03363 [Flavobacterium sp. TAB 87]|nr:hypothetical protein AP058_03363 [Flavobacterium sp. TAB 87]